MKHVQVWHYEAFSRHKGKGNPAGVVFEGDTLEERNMQEIAKKVGFNETAFVLDSDVADLRLRYFTPGHEMNLCGHGTVAALQALVEAGTIDKQTKLTLETKAGILNIELETKAGQLTIAMEQAAPQFERFNGSTAKLAEALGLSSSDLDDQLPIMYGSTGTWTLLVPIKSIHAFLQMNPQNREFPAILTEKPRCSVHPFCVETIDPDADLHGRHFSSPYSGTIEDPVTGTASGVMGAYATTYIDSGKQEWLVEQGQEIGKDGRVFVVVKTGKNDKPHVSIKGEGVYVGSLMVEIGE
ncbi:PhzF family phenazine biosynthesis isomerase [Shouchella clausii]|uniref:PhzF family phenazine biosynthesis isomerase n=1 Tax=Shouchella clausii TaxID=79880 RepID=UPI000B95F905|nr:PhzF family phenazine biosynthesis isomerase [Shouchella clausii]AST96508.1 isomerase [Shouchella clausii]MBU8596323.1 PhzF family phenazine biosynthesis isomerase [Shouchella clausii]MCR1289521.1 PhzF family phenazine biosynthesis isomerase [Shouchella clausii]MCY1103982.1 PhzF family phenazine biosynthesis isomerase [Shouchella clausii]MEB5474283.1 PhzF family phenazine biosynthesis isomerase [Shouchella clausii]